MKKDDEFIKSKLDAVLNDQTEQVEVPDTLRAKYGELASQLDVTPKPQKRRRTWIIPATAAIAAVATAVVLCCTLIPSRKDDSGKYNDNINTYLLTSEEFTTKFDVLLPNVEWESSATVCYDKATNTPLYAKINITALDNDGTKIIITIVLTDDYKYPRESNYDAIKTSISTELTDCLYDVITPRQALAKYEYNGYKYYVEYTSDSPSEITTLLSTLTLL